jgi:hypothetical protein
MTAEWLQLKPILIAHGRETLPDCYANFLHTNLDVYPNLGKLATIAVTAPVTSVNCERGVSCYNSIKTDSRAAMHVQTADTLMRLNLEAPSVRDFPYDEVFEQWIGQNDRRG